MNDFEPHQVSQFEADSRIVSDAVLRQQRTLGRQSQIGVERWEYEDLIAASDRLSKTAAKYEQLALLLKEVLPELGDVYFSDPSLTEKVRDLQRVFNGEQAGADESSAF